MNDGADARRAHLLNVTDIVLVAAKPAPGESVNGTLCGTSTSE